MQGYEALESDDGERSKTVMPVRTGAVRSLGTRVSLPVNPYFKSGWPYLPCLTGNAVFVQNHSK
jgi:hypothetical protein